MSLKYHKIKGIVDHSCVFYRGKYTEDYRCITVFEQNEKRHIETDKRKLLSSMVNNNNIHGYVASGWENVCSVFEQNLIEGLDLGASLCIYHRGQCVVDLSGGWKDPERNEKPYTADTLQLVFSTSKGVMAAAIALCVERGWLDYDAPVAKYWPEFAVNGKQVCIR